MWSLQSSSTGDGVMKLTTAALGKVFQALQQSLSLNV